MRPRPGRPFRAAAAALAAASCALAATASAVPAATPAAAAPAAPPVTATQCTAARDELATYGWPVRPFDRQHAIRGSFGDPRTVERSADPVDGPGSRGSFQFHNGIDIVAEDGTAVYPVLGGVAMVRHRHEVTVRTPGGRVFQYWHIDPAVRSGQRVLRDRTVLGRVQRGAHHVHLTEIDHMRVVNPLAPGHLGPYEDAQPPAVLAVLARGPRGHGLRLDQLHGRVALVAQAADEQPLRFWGPWFGKPVMPALIRWRLVAAAPGLVPGRRVLVPWRTAFDVRLHEPPPVRFWQVYAPGTYQNFPVLDDRFDWGRPGRYLVRLTPRLLDTRRLPDGAYVVEVVAQDVCGNRGELHQPIAVANGGGRRL